MLMHMSHIRNRKHVSNRYLTAALMAAAVPALTTPALAQDKKLAGVTVTAEEDTYKADVVSSPKQTQALIDTPQTVSVIKKEVLQQQQAASLMEALRNVPGITVQMGENGNTSAGDTFQMRGFDASTSVLVDGVRDMSSASRDTFNLEQVEVVRGAGGADIGRGASSGYINLVSKHPTLEAAASGTLAAYSQGGARATVDVNRAVGKTSGLRLNLMAEDINAVGRDEVKKSGYALAAAYGIGIGTPTRLYGFAQVSKGDNVPDGGIPSVGYPGFYYGTAAVKSAPRVDPENYYGSVNDYEDTESSQFTVKFEHDFESGVYMTNTTRLSRTSLDRVLTGVNTGTTGIKATNLTDRSTWIVNRSRQHVVKDNDALINATNFTASATTGAFTHDLSYGLEFSTEKVAVYGVDTITLVDAQWANLYTPNPSVELPINRLTGARTFVKLNVGSAYLFDTIHFGEKWLFNAGVRVDRYDITTKTLTNAQLKGDGTLTSYKAGLVYKPVETASLYVAYANAKTPPGTVNLGASTTTVGGSETSTNINNPNVDPTETRNLEAGVKWDVLSGRVSLTAAYYSTEHLNEFVEDPFTTGFGENFGKRTVKGFDLGLVGKITDKWNLTAGIQTMDTKVEEGQGTTTSATGAVTRWSPELAATVWTTYEVSPKLTLGGGARYTGEQVRANTPGVDLATQNVPFIPEYWVVDAYGAYKLTDKVSVQLNVYNLLDEDYIATLNNGGSRLIPGAPRSATVTLNYQF
jgi:catecholate siderophore receptor